MTVTGASFEARVGESFALPGVPGVELEVVAVDTLEPQGHSVVFRGPAEPMLPQATYLLDGVIDEPAGVFIVPIGADDEHVRYEAIFT